MKIQVVCGVKPISLTENALSVISATGKFALEEASKRILQSQQSTHTISDALNYYAKTILPRVLPIFPALTYLSCKAAGGNPEKTKPLASAMTLITASGDIHDDIIDKSTQKFGTKTVFGKYGSDVTLLAGDALLIQGVTALQNACNPLSTEQKEKINSLITEAMLEIAKAESIEISLRKKTYVRPQQFFEVIMMKAGIAELHCKVGGIVAAADAEDLENLASCGRLIGALSTSKEEFVDLLNPSELEHRIKCELPPYPMLCALQNKTLKKQIAARKKKTGLSRTDLQFVAEAVMDCVEVRKLKAELRQLGEEELASNMLLKNNEGGKELKLLVEALAIEL